MSPDKHCLFCQQQQPEAKRGHARYCSAGCRVRAYRERRSRGTAQQGSEPSQAPIQPPDEPRKAAESLPKKRARSRIAELRERIRQLEAQQARTRTWCAELQEQSEHRTAFRYEEFQRQITAVLTLLIASLFRQLPDARLKASLAAEAAPLLAALVQQFPGSKLDAQFPPILAEHVARIIHGQPLTGASHTAPRPNDDKPVHGNAKPPVNSAEAAHRQRLEQAIQAGYNPAVDALAFAKLEELEALDRLSRWQYHQTPQPHRRSAVTWFHPGWRLDSRSELDLLTQVYERVASMQHFPPRKPSRSLW